MPLTRNHLFSLSLGAVGGFVAGAFASGQWLFGIVGLVMGFWSVVLALVVAPPIISRRSKESILSALEDPELVAPVVLSLAAGVATRFDHELQAPADTPKPVLAAVNRMSGAMMASFQGWYAATKGHLEEELKQAGIGGADADSRWAAVVQGAARAGRPIPEKIQGTVDTLLTLRGIFESDVFKGKGERAALPAARRKTQASGQDGYL